MSEYDGGIWKELMQAVVIQAVSDARSDKPEKALDAVLWLVSDDMPLWLEAVGLGDLDAVKLVTSGRARRVQVGGGRTRWLGGTK